MENNAKSNEGNVASIIGFKKENEKKYIFSKAKLEKVKNINAYLLIVIKFM